MERLLIGIINIFISCLASLLIFCTLLELEFTLVRLFALFGIMLFICRPWSAHK